MQRTALDTIYLHGLTCQSTIGVWPWEKKITQSLVFDIDLQTDISAAAKSDDLQDALDYQALSDRVCEFAGNNSFDLIETLVERLAALILDEFAVKKVRIKLDKGQAVSQVKHVGVIIERSR